MKNDAETRLVMKSDDEIRLIQWAKAALEGDKTAAGHLLQGVRNLLEGPARKRILGDSLLGKDYEFEDLTQDFLVEKVLGNMDGVFAPVVSGERSLWAQIITSFKWHCDTLRRKAYRSSKVLPIEDHDVPDLSVADDTLQSALRTFQETIRASFEPKRSREVLKLLLSERIHLAEKISSLGATTYARPAKTTELEKDLTPWTNAELAEDLTPWTNAEQNQPLFDGGPSLQEAWEKIGDRLGKTPGPVQISGDDIANHLNVPRSTWDKWIQRARETVANNVRDNPEICRYLNHWPRKLLERTGVVLPAKPESETAAPSVSNEDHVEIPATREQAKAVLPQSPSSPSKKSPDQKLLNRIKRSKASATCSA